MDKDIVKKIYAINRRTDIDAKQKNLEITKLFKSAAPIVDEKPKQAKCPHYNRKCQIHCSKCATANNKFHCCRLCHDDYIESHKLNRFNVKLIKCRECATEQPPSNKCVNCNIKFADYFCSKCNLWQSGDNIAIYHCDLCKICRVGKKEDYVHCLKCNICIKNTGAEEHHCLENTARSNCPICGEELFTSTKPYTILKCGHSIHIKCFEGYTKTNYTCPICRKSLGDLQNYWKYMKNIIKQHPMPNEYKNIKVNILCNDCEAKSQIINHFMGNECPDCGSFNTSITN